MKFIIVASLFVLGVANIIAAENENNQRFLGPLAAGALAAPLELGALAGLGGLGALGAMAPLGGLGALGAVAPFAGLGALGAVAPLGGLGALGAVAPFGGLGALGGLGFGGLGAAALADPFFPLLRKDKPEQKIIS